MLRVSQQVIDAPPYSSKEKSGSMNKMAVKVTSCVHEKTVLLELESIVGKGRDALHAVNS